jgi:DNA helicase II / ATP-dependent DNA helicase PcrA
MRSDTPASPADFGGNVDFVFEDMFAQDADDLERLEKIAADLQLNDRSRVFDFTAQADAEQKDFIDCASSLIRLIAPAGSGKTQSIVNRVLSRVSKGERLNRFLMLTFDNSAGLSLSEKFRTGLASRNISVQEVPQVMTLNKFGFGLFRTVLSGKYGSYRIGEKPASDQREAVRRALHELRNSKPEIHNLLPRRLAYRVYADLFSTLKNNLLLPDKIFSSGRQQYIDWCKANRILSPWHKEAAHDSNEGLQIVNALANLYRYYCQIMAGHFRIDFDDQKLLPYLALAENEGLARAVSNQFRCIIVDEFQDINLLDFEFIRLIARDKELIVVGDDDQAIYAFRGCSPEFILRFPEYMKRPVETHVLNVNYRCPRNIMEMSARLIQHNTDRIAKSPTAAKDVEADVKLWHCLNSASEAQVIARTIKRIYCELGPDGFRYSDIAILCRMNSQSLPIQMALIREEIPYHCRKEDNIIVSETMERLLGLIGLHLKLTENPEYSSRFETRLLCECYFQYPRDADIDLLHRLVEQTGRYDHAAQAAGGKPGTKFTKSFSAAVASLFPAVGAAELVQTIALRFKNLGGIVGTLEDALNDSLPLGELIDIVGRFRGDLRQFHGMVSALLTKVQGGIYHGEPGDAVNLLTYFRAKGRQWHTVIIPGVNQKVVPHMRSKIEDERRLFYVAVTRATHNLLLSYVRQAVRVAVEPSQFLGEMGLGKGSEKRATLLSGNSGSASPLVGTPPKTATSSSPSPAPSAKKQERLPQTVAELIDLLDNTLFPAVAGTPARGARLSRLDRWRKALASSLGRSDPESLYAALASCDTAIASGNDGRKAKLALDRWWDRCSGGNGE